MHTPIRLLAAIVATASLSAACASGSASPATQTTPEAPAMAATSVDAQAPADPVRDLLASSDRLFEDGRHQLSLGHLAQAKSAFNASLELILASPEVTRSDARVREHLDRLVDRIAALELTALATGDGFTEQAAEPASIDQLLAISTFDTSPPTAATTENVEADLRETTHDLPIPLNERVLRYVELFQGRLREFLAEGLARGAQYLPMIQSVFRAEGLPLDLAYVPLIESAFKPTALSRAKARGVWQFMRGTGIENGLQQDWYIDERSDPAKATVAAARYFKTLYRMFDDWHLAMASYNGGPGRMQRAIKASRRTDFWSLTATSRYLPRETREYVPMILAAVIIAKNPAKYGFDVPPPGAPAIETVEVPSAVDLRRVAEWASVPVEEIQRLNPELRRWTTPIRGDSYPLTVPWGTAETIRAELGAASPKTLNALQWHVVKRGETLTTIARKLRVNRTDLAEANYLRATSRVTIGQKLLIPRMPSAALLARAAAGAPVQAEETDAVAAAFESTVTETVVHRVRRGDTLFALARKYQTTVAQLKALNRLSSNTLRIGARLVVATPRTANAQQQ
ncbi:MAG TPA: LysM peptidoglycan-binding domain-containing protein [Vicinamibacterales bacterium]|nr:LysM peptidoglycan-binding domain-containing protein [Vicinamibacterales bacterium]